MAILGGFGMQPGMGSSLGFPRMGAPTPPIMDPNQRPTAEGPAPAASAPPQAGPAPTGVMTTNPPASAGPLGGLGGFGGVFGRGFAPPQDPSGLDHGAALDHRLPDHFAKFGVRSPGFLGRLQALMGQNSGLMARIQQRYPGFDLQSFINGLQSPGGAPAAATGAASVPAAPAGNAAAPVPAAPTAPPAPGAVPAPQSNVVFNPLNLTGIGG